MRLLEECATCLLIKCFCSSSKGRSVNISSEYVDNIYIRVGNRTFCQCIGIPMGTDCAPLLANLYVFHEKTYYIRHAQSEIIFQHTEVYRRLTYCE
jgi:hypothetical protein